EQEGISFDEEMEIITAKGKQVWIRVIGEADRDDDGIIVKVNGTFQDISERKFAENQLQKLTMAVEQSPVSIFLTDIEGNIEYVNPKVIEITGYTLEELIGKNPKIFSAGQTPKSVYKKLWTTIASGKEWHGEFHNKKKNGEFYWELASISPIINKNGKITNYLAVKENITDRKEKEADLIVANEELAFQNEEKEKRAAELIVANKELVFQNKEKEKRAAELIVAKEHAEESDRLKSAFLANMSHEIRTPMNGILGFTELLKEPDLSNEKQQRFIDIIQKSGARLLNIINDIVDISKIEAGLMKTDIKTSNIKEQIKYIYTFFKPEFEKKGLQFYVKKNFLEEDLIVETDPEKIYAIFSNLIKNAIKFTNKGSVLFGYERKLEYLEFYVKDTGIGISKDKHEAIFKRFIQADISNDMAIQGAGLGLSISKAYVELLGGKIWVESEVENLAIGKAGGSAFYFTIPYKQVK
ncbi:MAG: PAS domain-containing sensor histidine kinase, partial [Lutibacter sp.]